MSAPGDVSFTLVVFMLGFLLLEFLVLTLQGIRTSIACLRLNRLLKAKHYDLWRELTSSGRMGPGLFNTSKSLPWLFRDEPGEDDELRRLKDAARIRTRWFFIVGGAFCITVASLFIGSIVYALVVK